MQFSGKRVFFRDLIFETATDVYEPAEDSLLFAEKITVAKGERVVDVGCGCGILGIVAASSARSVLATDLNPFAVRCAKRNARLNKVSARMTFVAGDLFSPIRRGEVFDVILFNAPYLPSKEDTELSWSERAWSGGANGRAIIDRFIAESPHYLSSVGHVLLMQSNLSDVDLTLKRFEQHGLRSKIVAELDLPFFETIALVSADRA